MRTLVEIGTIVKGIQQGGWRDIQSTRRKNRRLRCEKNCERDPGEQSREKTEVQERRESCIDDRIIEYDWKKVTGRTVGEKMNDQLEK